jgi:hypothetical protein
VLDHGNFVSSLRHDFDSNIYHYAIATDMQLASHRVVIYRYCADCSAAHIASSTVSATSWRAETATTETRVPATPLWAIRA